MVPAHTTAKEILKLIEKKEIKIKVIRVPIVSPFGLGLNMTGRMDLIRMEDRAKFLRRMHELHLKAISNRI